MLNKETFSLPYYFNSHTLKKCAFSDYLMPSVLIFVVLLMIVLFKMAPKKSTKLVSIIRKYKEVVIYLVKKICALDKLCSGMHFSAVATSSMIINQKYGTLRKRKFASLHMRLLRKCLINIHGVWLSYRKMEKWLNLWVHKMTTFFFKYSKPYFYESESLYTHPTCSSRSYSRHTRNDLKIKDSWLDAIYLPIQGEMHSSSKLIKKNQDDNIVIPFSERTKTV